MSAWLTRDAPPHPDWVSSRDFQCTGESFGFVEQPTRTVRESLNNMADNAAELGEAVEVDEREELNTLPADEREKFMNNRHLHNGWLV